MKHPIYKLLPLITILCLAGCSKRNYFPDQDDPGLSRLTFYGFNIATNYINDVPYINNYRKPLFGGIVNSVPSIYKIVTSSAFDTLSISWAIGINDNGNVQFNSPYQNISLLMPVPKSFSLSDFIAMGGKRFSSNTRGILINTPQNYSDKQSGTSDIYFIKINLDTSHLSFTGLFDGNIGDSILITKGRFDFKIDADQIKF
ncbi:MAG: hypothetical protein ABI366_00305 [Ginsengibacter sp.]